MSQAWEVTRLLREVLAELKKSNIIQKATQELHKQHFTEWREVTKGMADTTGDAFYRALSEQLEKYERGS